MIRLRGGGEEGVGEDVTYDADDHDALQDGRAGRCRSPATGRSRSFCEHLDGARPLARAAAARRLAPLPPLGLRVGGAGPRAAPGRARRCTRSLGREPRPVTFVVSLRLGEPGDARRRCARRLDALPDAALQARPDARLGRRAGRRARRDRRGRLGRPQGPLRGHGRRPARRPGALPARRRGVPRRVDRGPDARRRRPTRCSSPHRDRITWDAQHPQRRRHRGAAVPAADGERQAVALRRPARAVRRLRLLRRSTASACTAAGSSSSGPGRGQIQYLASLFHPDTPNDVAPGGYNDARRRPPGLPGEPAAGAAAPTGFRWG